MYLVGFNHYKAMLTVQEKLFLHVDVRFCPVFLCKVALLQRRIFLFSLSVWAKGVFYRSVVLNPLTPRRTLVSPFTEISILFYEGIIKKISYERSAYESVDEKSLS